PFTAATPGARLVPGALVAEGGVERSRRRREIELLTELGGFGAAMDAVHARVLPLDREGTVVADVVERDDHLLEVDVATPDAAEIPVAPLIAEGRVTAEHAGGAVTASPPDVLHVHVHDAVGEAPKEADVVDTLVGEVRRVVVERSEERRVGKECG